MSFQFKNNFAAIREIISEGSRQSVNDTVDEIADDAVSTAPRDKGAMAASIVAIKEGQDNDTARTIAESRAQSLRPDVEFDDGVSFDDFDGEGIHIGAVEVPVSYAPLIHNGFADRLGRPFLEQAGEGRRDDFRVRLNRNIADKLNS
jgi:hypothetical protein